MILIVIVGIISKNTQKSQNKTKFKTKKKFSNFIKQQDVETAEMPFEDKRDQKKFCFSVSVTVDFIVICTQIRFS